MQGFGKTAYIFYHSNMRNDFVDDVKTIEVAGGFIHIETYGGDYQWFPINDSLKRIELIKPTGAK